MTDQQIQRVINENGGNFTASEFLAGRSKMPKKIFREVALFRNWHGYSTQITSAWRPKGAHSFGAVDQLIWTKWRERQPSAEELWLLITTWPWMGVGIYFDWNDGIGVHLDLCTPNQRQRPLRWLRTKGIYYYQERRNGLFYTKTKNVDQAISLEREIAIYNERNLIK